MRALSRLADVAGFWTLDRTTITGRSAVILRQHTTPFRPMIVPFDDLELVYQSLRTLEPPHTHKFPRVNARRIELLNEKEPGRGSDQALSGRRRGACCTRNVDPKALPQASSAFRSVVCENIPNIAPHIAFLATVPYPFFSGLRRIEWVIFGLKTRETWGLRGDFAFYGIWNLSMTDGWHEHRNVDGGFGIHIRFLVFDLNRQCAAFLVTRKRA